MKKQISYQGQVVDMELLKFQNQHAVALGNAGLNARGDKIGSGGTVIKTREELLAEQERAMEVPDISPEHMSHSAAPAMDNTSMFEDDVFDDKQFEMPEAPAPKKAPVKRAPKAE